MFRETAPRGAIVFFESILAQIATVMGGELGRDEKLQTVAQLLKSTIPYYDWVGFYLVDSDRGDELVLGPFEGEPTEHVRIPFGKGVCGHVAEKKETVVVPDVSRLSNYLACSLKVQSEIVVPLLKGGELVGELDIDSHARAPFADADKMFLEKVAAIVAELW